ncbi:MAG: methylenetetrahydrofolate reductase [NAD(P)H] [Synergistaceae bacterium]|nr:methylenetetrahydrofolate reductase [NAD(P)H] [Synergistaceae bacterium]
MQIKELYALKHPVISFEVFPPKNNSGLADIYAALERMSKLSPDFISVTYGAGGGVNSGLTSEIASFIQNKYGICSIAHLTCIGASHESISSLLAQIKHKGVRNILALRGDLPEGISEHEGSYKYAEDLIRQIRALGEFCIGAACYPEGHIDCDDLNYDTACLRRKQEAGADFLITQLFFDNDFYYRFVERVRDGGVTLPISAGVMPILSRKQIERMIFLCGASLPSGIIKLLRKYENSPEALYSAGIEYAAKQISDLIDHGADGVHIYTMNKPEIAEFCMKYIGRA